MVRLKTAGGSSTTKVQSLQFRGKAHVYRNFSMSGLLSEEMPEANQGSPFIIIPNS
jgi:hypothetical protein